jgi:hypothetical protein
VVERQLAADETLVFAANNVHKLVAYSDFFSEQVLKCLMYISGMLRDPKQDSYSISPMLQSLATVFHY